MKFQVTKNEANPLFSRRDIAAVAKDLKETPSRREVLAEVCKALGGADEKLVVINKISQGFGEKNAVVSARAYDNTEALNTFEPKWRLARTQPEVREKLKELKAAKKSSKGAKKRGAAGAGKVKIR
jgi:ribosomal protein S24E